MRCRLALLALGLSSFACSKKVAFQVGGTVSGLAGTGLALLNNDGDRLAIAADGAFTFAATVPGGSPYAVTVAQQPTGPAQTCTVSGGSGVANAQVTAIAVTCSTNLHTVGGTITGLTGSGLVLQDNGRDDLLPGGNGAFRFATKVASGKTFTVSIKQQPDSPAQLCTVAGGSGTIVDGDVSSVSVNCTTSRYTVGGTVSGLAGTSLVLHDSGGDDLPLSSNGAFSFPTPIASGTAFSVTVAKQPVGPSQTCAVSAGSGTIAAGNVTTVSVTCLTNSYAVGGSVSGLVGSGLVVQDNLGDTFAVPGNGPFSFAAQVASGAAYSVTVLSQPTSPSQTCAVTSGSGTVTDGPVTSAVIACTTNAYFIGFTVTGLRGAGLTLTNNSNESFSVSADGTFKFLNQVASGQAFLVAVAAQPALPTQTCAVSGGSGVVSSADVSSVTVNCATNAFAVGGSVSGLSGRGLKLQISTGEVVAISGNGTFAFATPLPSGTSYTVSFDAQPSAPSQTCALSNASGTVSSQPVTNLGVTCTTNQFSVGGTVAGLSGAGLVLQDNGGDDLAVQASGAFRFASKVTSGQPFLVTVKTAPSAPAQTCLVSGGSGTVGGADLNVFVACTTNQYAVGGSISGLAGTVVLQNVGGDDLTLTANGTFQFPTRVYSGARYLVSVSGQPATPSQTCTVSPSSGPVVDADIASVRVACVTNTFSISGTVSGLSGSGLTLLDNGGDSLAVSQNGAFKFPARIASGSAFAVTVGAQPASPAQKCVVSGGTGLVGGSDVTTVAVNCSTVAFSVGGSVSGLAGGGLTLLDNNGDAKTISGNGTFAFATPLASGASYSVTIAAQPTTPWQTCSVSQGSGTIGSSDITNVAVACVTNSYPVKVATSGVAGTGLVLQDNAGDNLGVASSGTFSFPTAIKSGATYSVTVLTQPTSPSQTCTVTSASGVMANGVTVAVACTTNSYSIGFTVTNLNAAGLVVQDNGADDLAIAGNGSYLFPVKVASGATYSVAVKTQPASLYCFVNNGTGTVGSGAVNNVVVQCGVAPSCLIIKQSNPGATSGVYPIVPDGSTSMNAYCDMATDGGGWTLLAWTGNTSTAPYGVPYPGTAYCPALNCPRGSGVPANLLTPLFNRSREFASAAMPTAISSFQTIAGYNLSGKFTYSTLSGLLATTAPVSCGSGTGAPFMQGTFTNFTGMAGSNGLTAYLSQSFAYSGYDYSSTNYIWSLGAPANYCSGTGAAPGSYLGTWTSCNYPGNGTCTAGAFSIWIR